MFRVRPAARRTLMVTSRGVAAVPTNGGKRFLSAAMPSTACTNHGTTPLSLLPPTTSMKTNSREDGKSIMVHELYAMLCRESSSSAYLGTVPVSSAASASFGASAVTVDLDYVDDDDDDDEEDDHQGEATEGKMASDNDLGDVFHTVGHNDENDTPLKTKHYWEGTVDALEEAAFPASDRRVSLTERFHTAMEMGDLTRAYCAFSGVCCNISNQQHETGLEELPSLASTRQLLWEIGLRGDFETACGVMGHYLSATRSDPSPDDLEDLFVWLCRAASLAQFRPERQVGHGPLTESRFQAVMGRLRKQVKPYPQARRALLLTLLKLPYSLPSCRAARKEYADVHSSLSPLEQVQILELSTFRKRDYLPFWEIVQSMVDASGEGEAVLPKGKVLISILQHEYPFDKTDVVISLLESFLQIVAQVSPQEREDYRVDFGTLEQVAMAGATARNSDMVLLTWDLLEALGYSPNITFYESLIHALVGCAERRQDDVAWAVLKEYYQRTSTLADAPEWQAMPTSGAETDKQDAVSRALLRCMSRYVRGTEARVEHFYYMVTNPIRKTRTMSGTPMETSSASSIDTDADVLTVGLNTVLSSCAETGLVDRAFATYDDFARFGLEPTADTYSFLLEALAVDLRTNTPPPVSWNTCKKEETAAAKGQSDDKVHSHMEAAYAVMATMDKKQIAVSRHALHHFVALFCAAGEVDRAAHAVETAMKRRARDPKRTEMPSLDTLCVLAMEYGRRGRLLEGWKTLTTTTRKAGYGRIPLAARRRLEQLSEACKPAQQLSPTTQMREARRHRAQTSRSPRDGDSRVETNDKNNHC